MKPRRRRRTPAALLLAAALGAGVLAPLLLPGPSAAAGSPAIAVAGQGVTAARALPAAPEDDEEPLVITVGRLLPVSPQPGQTLVVAGSVSNPTDEPVAGVQVGLRLSPVPVSDRAELADIAAGRVESTGDRVPDTRIDVAEELAAGQVVKYRIEVPVDDLPWSSPGVYVLGVEALGAVADGANTRLGLASTFLPWIPPAAGVVAGGVVTLWPLAAAPAVDAEGVLLTPGLPTAVSTGGRLRILLDAGSSVPGVVSWVVDPATLEAVSQMTDGYRVNTADGPAAGTAVPAATGWLATARTALGSADVAAMPYAWPDAVALVRGGLQRDVVRATTAAPGAAGVVLQRPVTTTLAWPPGGTIDTETLAVLGDTGASGVLLSDTQLRPDPPVDFTPTGSAPLPALAAQRRAVVADAVLSGALASRASTAPQITLARARLVAELAMITLELPQTPRTVVMAPPMAWRPSEAYARTVVRTLASLPWVRPTSLSALLAAAPSDVTRALAPYPDAAANAQLPSSFVARIAATEREAATLAEIVGGASDGTGAVVGALQRSGSAFWRAERRTGDALLTRTTAGVDELTAKVRVVSSGSVSLPGETGTIPVTIANDLEVPVTVGLRVTGDPAVRLEASPVAPITIAPGRKTSVEVTARVAGSGSVTALLQLTTPSGQDYGQPARIEVGSAAYARAAAWVVGAAFALLLALVAVNTVRRVRVARVARRRGGAEGSDDGSMTP